jgi:hypothetical protein
MLAVSNGESRRAFALIDAFEGSEITSAEFSEEIRTLSSETMQVFASVLNLRNIFSSEGHPRLWAAGMLCRQRAACTRVLS